MGQEALLPLLKIKELGRIDSMSVPMCSERIALLPYCLIFLHSRGSCHSDAKKGMPCLSPCVPMGVKCPVQAMVGHLFPFSSPKNQLLLFLEFYLIRRIEVGLC